MSVGSRAAASVDPAGRALLRRRDSSDDCSLAGDAPASGLSLMRASGARVAGIRRSSREATENMRVFFGGQAASATKICDASTEFHCNERLVSGRRRPEYGGTLQAGRAEWAGSG